MPHEPTEQALWWRGAEPAIASTLGRVTPFADALSAALRAADAVADPRREAERRVVEAARAWWETWSVLLLPGARLDGSRVGDLRDALAVLAALDGEGGT